MSTELKLELNSLSLGGLSKLGHFVGSQLRGGETVLLSGDIGSGKTTFTKYLAKGFGSEDQVSSPSFTLSNVYSNESTKLQIHHYDFYRLNDPGILKDEIQESVEDSSVVTVVEWAQIVSSVLPHYKLVIEFKQCEDPELRDLEVIYNENTANLIKDFKL